MIRATASRVRVSFVTTVAAFSLAVLVACGGGDELASPVPVAIGSGMGTVTLDGVDLGETQLVTSGIASAATAIVAITGEAVTFVGDPPLARLANDEMASDTLPGCAIVVEDAASPGTFYATGTDFTTDFTLGTLTANPDGMGGYRIPDGTAVTVNYCARQPMFTVSVGVTIATGDFVSLTFFNVPEGASGMRNTNVVANLPPPDGSFAFTVGVATNLTLLDSDTFRVLDDPAQNDATIVSADLTNTLNPCIEGRVVALLQDNNSREEALLEVNFNDPECP